MVGELSALYFDRHLVMAARIGLLVFILSFCSEGGLSIFSRLPRIRSVHSTQLLKRAAGTSPDPISNSSGLLPGSKSPSARYVNRMPEQGNITSRRRPESAEEEDNLQLEWPVLIIFTDEALRIDPALNRIDRLVRLLRRRWGADVAVCNIDRDLEARRAWQAVQVIMPDLPRYMPLCYNRKTGEVKALPCSVSDLMGWALGQPGTDDRPDPSGTARVYGEERSAGQQGAKPSRTESETESGDAIYLHMLGFDDFISEPVFRVQAFFDYAQKWLLKDGWKWAIENSCILYTHSNETIHAVFNGSLTGRLRVPGETATGTGADAKRPIVQRPFRWASELSKSLLSQTKHIAVQVLADAVDKLVL